MQALETLSQDGNGRQGATYALSSSLILLLLYGGSTIDLAGCGIWLIFVPIFGMGAENRSGKREFHLRAGAGFCVFEESGCENRKGKVAGYGILIFTRLHNLTGAG